MLEKIVVDEIEYPVESLTKDQQTMLRLFQKWSAEAEELKDDLLKAQAAIRNISDSVVASVRQSVAEKEAAELKTENESVNTKETEVPPGTLPELDLGNGD